MDCSRKRPGNELTCKKSVDISISRPGLSGLVDFSHFMIKNRYTINHKKNQMKIRLSIAAIMFMLLLFALPYNLQAQKMPKHKIVMQLSSADTLNWKGLMNNLRNLKEGWGDSLLIEVVAHGPGIELLMQQKTTQLENIRKMKAKGIIFYACENTMKEKKISPESIIAEAAYVKMGIGHIVLRQEAGWSYIKAGF
jgi:uncharacterized protein